MKIDLTSELARLLEFAAKIAIAIRMYSAYNQSGEHHEDAPSDLMWLSDSLHNFDMLGRAVLDGSPPNIILACDTLSRSFRGYQEIHPNSTRQAKPTFDRNAKRIDLNEAIAVFEEIRSKAAAVQQNS